MGPSSALSVRCLGCGSVYVKPLGDGTAGDNPGCPKCAYVGWIPTEASFRPGAEQSRFFADPLLRPSWRPR
jgi:hypothetical protein